MEIKRILSAIGIVFIATMILQNSTSEVPDMITSYLTLIGFSFAGVGISHTFFNGNKKIDNKEVLMESFIVIGVFYLVFLLSPTVIVQNNIFLKEAFFGG